MHHTSKMLSSCCHMSYALSSTTSLLAADSLPHWGRSIHHLSSKQGSLTFTQRHSALQQVIPAVLQSHLGISAVSWGFFPPLVVFWGFLVGFGFCCCCFSPQNKMFKLLPVNTDLQHSYLCSPQEFLAFKHLSWRWTNEIPSIQALKAMQVPEGYEGNTRDEHSWAANFILCASVDTSSPEASVEKDVPMLFKNISSCSGVFLSGWFAPEVQQFFQITGLITNNNRGTVMRPSRQAWYNWISPLLWTKECSLDNMSKTELTWHPTNSGQVPIDTGLERGGEARR